MKMNISSEDPWDLVILSYKRILAKFKLLNITKKNGKEITEIDLRKAILFMLKKHPLCEWRTNVRIFRNTRYYILAEGYSWLIYVYFQKEKTMVDADIDFFLDNIRQYENFLKIEYKETFWDKAMAVKELAEYFEKDISTIRKAIRKMCNEGHSYRKHYIDKKVVIDSSGIEWLCKNIFKHKYLQLLEKYKMKLTKEYIEAGYIYGITKDIWQHIKPWRKKRR